MFKKFCIGFLCIMLALLVGTCGLVYVVDPFNVYRADKDMTKIIYQMPYFQNIGIAKYTEYDTLITGTSMTQNFRANRFDDKLGCKAVRLSFDGGIVSDFQALLETATENNRNLKTVYFGLDNYLITADSKLNSIDERIPEYQLDNNPLTDVQYLFNKDVIFKYIPTYFSYKKYDGYNFYEMHAWDNGKTVYSKENIIKNYEKIQPKDTMPADSFKSDCEDFLNAIGIIVRENPNVDFVFFAPPYSVLYWDKLLRSGTFDATLTALNYVYGELFKYENVRIFYFQSDFEKISSLDKYKDENHYCTEYNDYMITCFKTGEHEVTAKSYKSELEKMRSFALSYDFDTLLGDK